MVGASQGAVCTPASGVYHNATWAPLGASNVIIDIKHLVPFLDFPVKFRLSDRKRTAIIFGSP